MNKTKQGIILRELFENKMRDVFHSSDEYCYLKRFNLKNRKLGTSNIYRFYPITTEQESYPEGTKFLFKVGDRYISVIQDQNGSDFTDNIEKAMKRYTIGDAYNILDYFRNRDYSEIELEVIYPKGA